MSKEGAEIPKPSDFFLGIVNVLGILVPGAVLLFLNADWLLPAFRLSLDAHWTIIAAAAYILGQLLLASTEVLNFFPTRLPRWVYPGLRQAEMDEEKSYKTKGEATTGESSRFHEALSYVRTQNGAATEEIDRHFADAKLLRSLVAVFLIDLVRTAALCTAPCLESGKPACWVRPAMDVTLVTASFLCFVRLFFWTRLFAFQYARLLSTGIPLADKKP